MISWMAKMWRKLEHGIRVWRIRRKVWRCEYLCAEDFRECYFAGVDVLNTRQRRRGWF